MSIRATRFAKEFVKETRQDKPAPMKDIIRRAGYGIGYQKNPKLLMQTKGVIEALAKAGITADSLANEWEKVLKAQPDPSKPISWDSKIKGLSHLSDIVYTDKESKIQKTYQFIDKFLNIEKYDGDKKINNNE